MFNNFTMARHILYTKGDLWGGFPVLIPPEIITIIKDARDEAARDEAARDKAARDEAARDEAARDKAARDEAARYEANKHDDERNESVVSWCVEKNTILSANAKSFVHIPMPKTRTIVYTTTQYGRKRSVKYV